MLAKKEYKSIDKTKNHFYTDKEGNKQSMVIHCESPLSFHEYFMRMAYIVAEKASCLRKHVGSVIVQGKRVIATGFCGHIPGKDKCNMENCIKKKEIGEPCDSIHAEQNALGQAARYGISTEGADVYITCFPCENCFKILCAAGIKNIYYDEPYKYEKRAHKSCYKNTRTHLRRLSFIV